jgi:hypothetical protein
LTTWQRKNVALAKELHVQGLSYRKISAELAVRGHVTRTGKLHVCVGSSEDAGDPLRWR